MGFCVCFGFCSLWVFVCFFVIIFFLFLFLWNFGSYLVFFNKCLPLGVFIRFYFFFFHFILFTRLESLH